MKKNMQGFTLIELMIVIAIIAILVAIALPQYQNYTIRAKNSECLSVAASPKLALAETFTSNGTWPTSFTTAGYTGAATSFCGAATIATNGFTIDSTVPNGSGTFRFTANTANTAAITWDCSSTGFSSPAHVPATCR